MCIFQLKSEGNRSTQGQLNRFPFFEVCFSWKWWHGQVQGKSTRASFRIVSNFSQEFSLLCFLSEFEMYTRNSKLSFQLHFHKFSAVRVNLLHLHLELMQIQTLALHKINYYSVLRHTTVSEACKQECYAYFRWIMTDKTTKVLSVIIQRELITMMCLSVQWFTNNNLSIKLHLSTMGFKWKLAG